jgi:cation transport ATPase
MKIFFDQKPVPAWRIVLWGVVAAACLMGVAVAQGESWSNKYLLIVAASVGIFISGFGFILKWSRSSSWMRANAYWLIAIGTLVNILLLLWDILHKK